MAVFDLNRDPNVTSAVLQQKFWVIEILCPRYKSYVKQTPYMGTVDYVNIKISTARSEIFTFLHLLMRGGVRFITHWNAGHHLEPYGGRKFASLPRLSPEYYDNR